MKKRFLIIILLSIAIALIIKGYNFVNVSIAFNPQEYVRIVGLFSGDDVEVEDPYKIKQFLEYINSIKKRRQIIPHQTCQTPDISLELIKNEKNNIVLDIYGLYFLNDGIQYKLVIDDHEFYSNIEKILSK